MKRTILMGMRVIQVFLLGIAVVILAGTVVYYDYALYLTSGFIYSYDYRDPEESEQFAMLHWQQLVEYVKENAAYYERYATYSLTRYNEKNGYTDMSNMADYTEVMGVILKYMDSIQNVYDPETKAWYVAFRCKFDHEWYCNIIYSESDALIQTYSKHTKITDQLIINPFYHFDYGRY